ncbi:DNA polymerase III subunit beta [Methyloceanibacter superfactus]|uniref:Beta sliding clamp n=1 Tax=Methyloceanibacter superfactus TaxID=1774969 RepID=A0A1E3W7H0_9HYPH|nr:DNA polymerase III subunit beta [Methyloceanibacter superfactus]ODS01716.1 DNA polymerase III subunit beta [Methyloceanibacter superfactus]
MRLTIDKPSLAKALAHVASVVERRNTIPILSNVLLAAGTNELRLTATDLDMELVETVPCRSSGDSAITVPAHMFYDIVRKLPEGNEIELERDAEQERVVITSGPAQFSLQTLPADDFPALSVDDLDHSFKLPAADLRRLIEKTRFAISTEETRYYLNGIYLHAAETDGKPTLRAVATDGHRLAQVELPLPTGAEGMPGVIVPRKTVVELSKLVENADGEVRVELSPAKIRVSAGRVVLASKLIDGTFPDYERVIPQGNDKRMEVDNAAFAQAVDRVSTLSSDKGRAVKLALSEGKLVLSVNNPDSGSATEELAVDYGFDPLEIGFTARYLLDITGQLDSGTAEFQLADPGSPTMVRDVKDPSALYVLMPMRV